MESDKSEKMEMRSIILLHCVIRSKLFRFRNEDVAESTVGISACNAWLDRLSARLDSTIERCFPL